jgi:hypothetical protein
MKLAVVVSGFPRRSETFMLGELLALEANGALVGVFATKLGETGPAQPGTERLTKYVEFLPDVSIEEQAKAVRMMLARKKVMGFMRTSRTGRLKLRSTRRECWDVPFGFSTHARDARKVAPSVLGQRARDAAASLRAIPMSRKTSCAWFRSSSPAAWRRSSAIHTARCECKWRAAVAGCGPARLKRRVSLSDCCACRCEDSFHAHDRR